MPEVNNFKRKRANRSCVVNIDGNCTPSDSDTDDEEHDRLMLRKIVRRSSDNGAARVDDDESTSTVSLDSDSEQRNSQLLYAALQKIQELENELAELDQAEYDSGHHDDDDVDEGNVSDSESNHNHRDEILDGQAEALGFAFCMKETFEYLAAQGIDQQDPIATALRQRFLGQCNQLPFD